MSWFSRRKPQGDYPQAVGVTSGVHRSPGMAVLSEELAKRRVETILDLGTSLNENLEYLSRFCENISIRDLVGAGGGPEHEVPRATLFQIDVESPALEVDARFDVVLLWDLLHYVPRKQSERFVARLAEMCHAETLVLLMASGSTPIPLTPIRLKIRDRDHLTYEVTGERRSPAPHFTPREVEQTMKGFRPVRFFQLRNGLQEFLFRYEGATGRGDTAENDTAKNDTAESEVPEGRPPADDETQGRASSTQPGDWY